MYSDNKKLHIFRDIQSLLDVGYELRLTRTSIAIIEPYKSEVGDRWIEKEVTSCVGLKNFDDATLHITEEKFERWVKDYVVEPTQPNKESDAQKD